MPQACLRERKGKSGPVSRHPEPGLPPSSRAVLGFLALVAVWFTLLPVSAGPPRLLVLHSNHPEYPWTAALSEGIAEELSRTNGGVLWHTEYLDGRRTDVERSEAALLELFASRFSDRRFDAVIATDRKAVEFVGRHGDRIAPGSQRVYAGLTRSEIEALGNLPGWSGVEEEYDVAGNLALIRRLLPRVRRILAVYNEPNPNSGSTIDGIQFQERLVSPSPDVSITVIRRFRFEELPGRLADAGPDAAVYVDGIAADEGGNDFSPPRIRELASASTVPVFTSHDEVFTHLGVGGRVTGGKESGRLAASLALARIAAPGAPLQRLGSPKSLRFRHSELERWGIPESLLPPDSEVVGRPPGLLERFGLQVAVAAGLIGGLALTVVLLARSNRDRRDTLRRLSENEILYRTLVEQSPDAVVLIDADPEGRGRILSVNAAGAALHGYTPEAMVGMRIQELDTPESAALAPARLARLVQGETLTFPVEHFHRDGSRLPLEVTARGIRLNGRPCVLATERDLRARRRQEQRFRELAGQVAARSGEEFLTAVVEFLVREFPVGTAAILLRGPAGSDTVVPCRIQHRGTRMQGWSRPIEGTPEAEVLDGRVLLVLSGLRRRFPEDAFARAEGLESFVGVPLRAADGAVIGLVACAAVQEFDGAAGEDLLAVLQVLAHSVAAEILQMETVRQLALSERQHRQLIENAPVGVVLVQDGELVYSNPAAGRLTAVPEAISFLGKPALDFVAPTDHAVVGSLLARASSGGPASPSAVEIRLQRLDGRQIPVELRAVPSAYEGRPAVAMLITDLSERLKAEEERRRMEAQLRQSNRLEALGVLTGGVAHDFNNLLTAILGNLELAEALLPEGSPARNQLAAVRAPAARAGDLVSRMMAFVRRDEARRGPVDLARMARELVDLLRPTLPATVSCRLELEPTVPRVHGDSTQLNQLLLNLCTNAIHALEESGGNLRVSVSTCRVDPPEATASGLQPGVHVALEVEDDGCGMDAPTLERIFDPFFTTKPTGKGTGLGLALVQGAVRDHGGAIRVQSAVGKGTTFRVLLPATREPIPGDDPPTRPTGGRGERILVVDDESSVALVAVRFLESLGYSATSCTDPVAAVSVFRDATPPFDAVVSDLTMPQLNGIALLAELRRIRPEVRVLLSSGFSGSLTPESARQAGFASLLQKPYTLAAMGVAMAEVLGRSVPVDDADPAAESGPRSGSPGRPPGSPLHPNSVDSSR